MYSIILAAVLLVTSFQPFLSIAAQNPQRERRVVQQANTRPTPTPTPTSSPAAADVEEPTSSPSATPDVAKIRAATTTKSLADLQSRINQVLQKPELESAMIGVKVVSLETGRVVFEANANKLLRPASNMKLYTISAALDRLSPDYHFVTSVYGAQPNSAGVVKGDLTIYGRGDPSIAARFNHGDYFIGIDQLASRIVAAGVKKVEGDLVGDESYFNGSQYGSGWEWEDLTWWYGAEVSALTVNDNALDLFVKPASRIGDPAVITTGPPDPLLRVVNQVVTASPKTKRNLNVYRELNGDEVVISGSIAVDDRGYSGGIGLSNPALLFAYLLRSSLAQHGVTITGKTRAIGASREPGRTQPTNISLNEIANLQSPPLSVVAANTLKPSQNLYAELVLRTLGRVVPAPNPTSNANRTSEDAGIEVVKAFLREAGVTPAALVLHDGSGLSRNDMITTEATVQLLTYMHRHRYAQAFRDALPIAGVDGTLRNRFKGTPAENNLRAKTGSLSSAASLSGYVRDAAGEDLVFSIIVNNYPEDTEVRAACIDPIATLLAAFNARTQ